MYDEITGEDPYKVPMRIYPALHYTMGGLWVDYNLMTTIPGLFVLGEANFSDHGANRLGASALMQGLADGYFIIPVHDRRLPGRPPARRPHDRPPGVQGSVRGRRRPASKRLLGINGKRTRRDVPLRAGHAHVGPRAAWPATSRGSSRRSRDIRALREEFWKNVQGAGRRATS